MTHRVPTSSLAVRALQTVILALCACLAHQPLASAQPSPAPARAPSTNPAKKADQTTFTTPCPMTAVKRALRMRGIKPESIICTQGHFPEPGYAISYWTDTDTEEPKLHLRVMAKKG